MSESAEVQSLVELLQKDPKKLAAVKRMLAGEPLADLQPHPPLPGCSPSPEGGFQPVPLAAMMVGDPVSRRFSIHYAPAGEVVQPIPSESAEASPPDLSLAAKVFQLLTALDPGNHWRRGPPIKVFLLRFRQGLSYSEIARACHCSRTLVELRLKMIREKLPWEPQQLRELSAQVEAMQEAVSDSRARRIYRKGAVYGEDQGGENAD